MSATRVSILMLCGVALTVAVGHTAPTADPQSARRAMLDRLDAPSVVAAGLVTVGKGMRATQLMLLDDPARRIGFQDLLTNEQGGPIPMPNGQHELDFRLYDSEAGGVPIGQVLDVLVILDGGVASTQVGPMDPTWFDGTGRWMGVTVDNGDELEPLIALGSVPYAFRVDRVASVELDDDIDLGDSNTGGSLTVYSGGLDTVTIILDGPAGQIRVNSPDGQGGITLHGQGQLMETRDDSGLLVALYGYDFFGGGAACLLGTAGGTTGLLLDGDAAGNSGGSVVLYNAAAAEAISLSAADGTIRAGSATGGVAGNMHLYPSGGAPSRIHLDGQGADLRLGLTGDSDGDLRLWSTVGGINTIHLNGGSGVVSITDAAIETIRLDGDGGNGGGVIAMWNSAGTRTVEIDADEGDNAVIRLGAPGDRTGTPPGATGALVLYPGAVGPNPTVQLRGSTGEIIGGWASQTSGTLWLYSEDDKFGDGPRIHLNGQNGWTTTSVLNITGGSDLSERFDIRAADGDVKPGMVVCIDAQHAGKLVVSTSAYDRTIAGIVSGAGGVRPGMLMGQAGSKADGQYPVALTGRVYVWADATTGAIQPGDLLTSSDKPGHAMKVTDYARAQGSIIGKAMSGLQQGETDLLLVLVSLQ